jgi:hypothetical protein
MNGANSNTSGDNQARFRLKPPAETDRIPAWLAEEMTRRGYVVLQFAVESNVVIQATEPEDKTKVWFLADANGIPQGSAQVYNQETGKWGPVYQGVPVYVPPMRRNGEVSATAGSSSMTVSFESVETINYFVTLTPTSKKADGSGFNAPPATVPLVATSSAFWIVSGMGDNTFTVNFYGIPTGGLLFLWEINVIPQA